MLPPPGPASRPGIAAPARPTEGDAAVAYDVQPTVVVVLVGALALLAVVAVAAVLTLAPTGRSLAEAPLRPATSMARGAPGETAGDQSAGAPGAEGATASTPSTGAAAPLPDPSTGAVPPGGDPASRRGPDARSAASEETASAGGQRPSGPATGARAPADLNAAAGGGSTGSPPPPIPIAGPPVSPADPAAVVPVDLDVVPGQSTALVRWEVSGPTVELGGFRVLWSGGGRNIDQQVGPEVRTAQAEGLMPGTGYAVAITPIARDGQPVAGAAQTIGVTTLPRSLPPPAAPANLALSAGPGSLTVSWTADPADLATTRFQISWACCSRILGGVSVDREVRSYTITGLASGLRHTVAVQALGPDLDADQSTRRSVDGTPG